MSGHVVPVKIYFAIFGTLLLMTAITVGASFIDLGRLNLIVALSIAVFKATLVALYFMHVRYSDRLTQIVLGAALLWLVILIVGIMHDPLTRTQVTLPRGW